MEELSNRAGRARLSGNGRHWERAQCGQRVWSAFGVQPHRQSIFKLSTDPFFVEKLVDITRALPQSAGACDGALCR